MSACILTGTTWLGEMILLSLVDGNKSKMESFGPVMFRAPYLEMCGGDWKSAIEMMKIRSPPRVMKTHLLFKYLEKPVEQNHLKTIVLLRNPKDTLVSLHKMYQSRAYGGFRHDFHGFFELFKARRLICGDIFEWYESWLKVQHLDNVKVVFYEDLMECPFHAMNEILKFLGKTVNEERLKGIINSCSFTQMKDTGNLFRISSDKRAAEVFFRKGKVGDWKNVLTEEESAIIDCHVMKCIKPFGISFRYE